MIGRSTLDFCKVTFGQSPNPSTIVIISELFARKTAYCTLFLRQRSNKSGLFIPRVKSAPVSFFVPVLGRLLVPQGGPRTVQRSCKEFYEIESVPETRLG